MLGDSTWRFAVHSQCPQDQQITDHQQQQQEAQKQLTESPDVAWGPLRNHVS